jgi:uncharacterized protein (TIGR03083 family)
MEATMQESAVLAEDSGQSGLAVPAASDIPALGHAEAMTMATAELDRFLQLLERLDTGDWQQPTACTLWDVWQMVAHLASSAAGLSSRSEFRRGSSGQAQRPYRRQGLDKLGAMNQVGVEDRADRTPAELIVELRECGPRAIATRRKLPGVLRALPLPMGLTFPFGKTWIRLGYLTDLILTRDMWIHRLDISRATEREMVLTPEHDGRVTALVVRDLSRPLAAKLDGRSVVFELAGPAGGRWRIGSASDPSATVLMDASDFHWLAAARTTAGDVRQQGLATVSGDADLANRALDHTWVPY